MAIILYQTCVHKNLEPVDVLVKCAQHARHEERRLVSPNQRRVIMGGGISGVTRLACAIFPRTYFPFVSFDLLQSALTASPGRPKTLTEIDNAMSVGRCY